MADSKDALSTLPALGVEEREKPGYEDNALEDDKGKLSPGSDHAQGFYENDDGLGSTKFVNGEPVITDGKDVSRYSIDVRDDGDPPITFRSFVLGTILGGLGAALYQVSS
jgi:hypothetical protein